MRRHLGLDLGGTNIKWALLEQDGGGLRPTATGSEPTVGHEGPSAVVARLAALAGRLGHEAGGVTSVGVGVPGLYDPATGVARFMTNLPGIWRGTPIGDPVAEAVGAPTRLINDVRACTLAELRLGAGRGVRTLLCVALGTGVGGGLAIDGEVLLGHDGTAGEIGHQTIVIDGPRCGCGNDGCLEPLASAGAVAAAAAAATAEEAAAAAAAGDERALAGLAQVGRYLGIGIANVIVLVNPDRVVIGGGVAAVGEPLLGPVRDEIRRRVRVTDLTGVDVVQAELGPWAGAVGAGLHGAEVATA